MTVSVHPVDNHVLVTLADANSGARVLIVMDSLGTRLRETRLVGMFGFLAIDPRRLRAIGVRELNGPEVILYRWRWRVEP